MASALVHLGIDQTQHHVGQPPTLTTLKQFQRRHAANINYWYCCWTSADLQKQPGTDMIYCGSYVVQNQYQDLF